MNGRRKYKVTIRVVDHPPRTRISYRDPLGAERNEQKTDPLLSEDNTNSSGIKSVYKSSVSVQVSDKRSHSCVHNSASCTSPKGCEVRSTNATAESHDRAKEDMPNSEFCECTKPLLRENKTTSLNINKLTRNNAIDQEELDELNVDVNNIASCECTKAVKFITTEKLSPRSCSSAEFEAKYGVHKPRNGFPRHLPIVVLNSGHSVNMDEASYEQNIVTDNAIGNGITDDFFSDSDALRRNRPPLNREGSACSSDSIITEIEGLTDDEDGELKDCPNEGGGSGNIEEVYKFPIITCVSSNFQLDFQLDFQQGLVHSNHRVIARILYSFCSTQLQQS